MKQNLYSKADFPYGWNVASWSCIFMSWRHHDDDVMTLKRFPHSWPLVRESTAWRCPQIKTFSALLVLCAVNSPVTCDFPRQRPVTRSFDVFFDLRLNKWCKYVVQYAVCLFTHASHQHVHDSTKCHKIFIARASAAICYWTNFHYIFRP